MYIQNNNEMTDWVAALETAKATRDHLQSRRVIEGWKAVILLYIWGLNGHIRW